MLLPISVKLMHGIPIVRFKYIRSITLGPVNSRYVGLHLKNEFTCIIASAFILNRFTLKQSINVLANIVPTNAWILTTPLSRASNVSRNFIPEKKLFGSTVVCVALTMVRIFGVAVIVGNALAAVLFMRSTLSCGQLLKQAF